MSIYTRAADLLEGALRPRIDWTPTEKQQLAIDASDNAFETLYGGAAFGGKSHLISHLAAQDCMDLPGAHVAIMRRTLPMLKQTHLLTLRPLLHDLAKFNAADFTWSFPNGSILRFISLPNRGDEQNYKSAQFDRLYPDELTEFLEEQYTYMLTRVRSKNGHRVRVLAASNPEGTGYTWVKKRFITPTLAERIDGTRPAPFEIWRPALPGDGQPGPGRVFVPATVYDNPHGLAANPEYVRQLQALPDARKRAALLEGDWEAMSQTPGALFDLTNIDANRVHTPPERLDRVVVAVDPAATYTETSDDTGIITAGSVGRRTDRHLYVLEDNTLHAEPAAWGRAAVQAWARHAADAIVYETNQGGDMARSVIVTAARDLLNKHEIDRMPKVIGVRATRGKAVRAEPIAALYAQGRVHHVGQHPELEEQLTTWTPEDPSSPDRLDATVWSLTHLSAVGGSMGGAFE